MTNKYTVCYKINKWRRYKHGYVQDLKALGVNTDEGIERMMCNIVLTAE